MDVFSWTWLLAALCAAAYVMAERSLARPQDPPEPLPERVRGHRAPLERD
jgi:hypothetical protein